MINTLKLDKNIIAWGWSKEYYEYLIRFSIEKGSDIEVTGETNRGSAVIKIGNIKAITKWQSPE